MGIDKITSGALMQPLVPKPEDVQGGLSRLIRAPSLDKLWVDTKGRIHKLVNVDGFISFLKYLVARVNKLVNEMDYSQVEKAQLLIGATKNLIDQFTKTLEPTGWALDQIKSLTSQLDSIAKKLLVPPSAFQTQKETLLEKQSDFSQIEYFSSVLKAVKVGAEQFDNLTPSQKFLLIPPGTKLEIPMIQKLLETPTTELKIHAARHLCALEKTVTQKDELLAAEQLVGDDALIEAACEFKVIPIALILNENALGKLLDNLISMREPFAKTVISALQALPEGRDELEAVVKKQLRTNDLKKVQFIETVCGESIETKSALRNLASLAIAGTLAAPSRSLIDPILVELNEMVDDSNKLSAAMNIYSKIPSTKIRKFMEDLVLEAPKTRLLPAFRDALAQGDLSKMRLVLSFALIANAQNQSEEMNALLCQITETLAALHPAVLETIIEEKLGANASLQLSLLQLVFGEIMARGSIDVAQFKNKITAGLQGISIETLKFDLSTATDQELHTVLKDLIDLHDKSANKVWTANYLLLLQEKLRARPNTSATLQFLDQLLTATLEGYTLPQGATPDPKMVADLNSRLSELR